MSLLLRSIQPSRLNLHLLRQISSFQVQQRLYSQKASGNKTVTTAKERAEVGEAKPMGEKVKETVKTTSYLGVIVIGIGVTGIMFWTIFSELFSSNSPQASELKIKFTIPIDNEK